ncbi:hypothetical protein XENOCAPTIV_001939 [Xenoophorus captivus]|uniref:Uncharacterized protein n=1 Tax=Xenoophorus captivus TaxID=1517983 RepID=A0ABV0S4W6_9TELE
MLCQIKLVDIFEAYERENKTYVPDSVNQILMFKGCPYPILWKYTYCSYNKTSEASFIFHVTAAVHFPAIFCCFSVSLVMENIFQRNARVFPPPTTEQNLKPVRKNRPVFA